MSETRAFCMRVEVYGNHPRYCTVSVGFFLLHVTKCTCSYGTVLVSPETGNDYKTKTSSQLLATHFLSWNIQMPAPFALVT